MNWCLWLHLLFQSHKKCLFLVSSTTDVIAITNLATDICFWCIFCLDFGSKFDPKTIKTMARQPNPNAINLKFREQINNEQQRLEINWNFVWKENIALDPPSTNIYIYLYIHEAPTIDPITLWGLSPFVARHLVGQCVEQCEFRCYCDTCYIGNGVHHHIKWYLI